MQHQYVFGDYTNILDFMTLMTLGYGKATRKGEIVPGLDLVSEMMARGQMGPTFLLGTSLAQVFGLLYCDRQTIADYAERCLRDESGEYRHRKTGPAAEEIARFALENMDRGLVAVLDTSVAARIRQQALLAMAHSGYSDARSMLETHGAEAGKQPWTLEMHAPFWSWLKENGIVFKQLFQYMSGDIKIDEECGEMLAACGGLRHAGPFRVVSGKYYAPHKFVMHQKELRRQQDTLALTEVLPPHSFFEQAAQQPDSPIQPESWREVQSSAKALHDHNYTYRVEETKTVEVGRSYPSYGAEIIRGAGEGLVGAYQQPQERSAETELQVA